MCVFPSIGRDEAKVSAGDNRIFRQIIPWQYFITDTQVSLVCPCTAINARFLLASQTCLRELFPQRLVGLYVLKHLPTPQYLVRSYHNCWIWGKKGGGNFPCTQTHFFSWKVLWTTKTSFQETRLVRQKYGNLMWPHFDGNLLTLLGYGKIFWSTIHLERFPWKENIGF